MSANDGGDSIQLSREPVPKPVIPRGRTLVPAELFNSDRVIGDRVTFSWRRKDADLTFHEAPIIGFSFDDVIVDVLPETVVTWDVAPNPN